MDTFSRDDLLEFHPGFRFHPTDQELITYYLLKKVLDSSYSAVAIGEIDINKVEPTELPWRAKVGEKKWFFFCVKDDKLLTGVRTKRGATGEGYWRADSKEKKIFVGKDLVGMKRTLHFFKRKSKSGKTSWISHEYRLDGIYSHEHLPKSANNEWVIRKVYRTNGRCGGKVPISRMMMINCSSGNEQILALPPSMGPTIKAGKPGPSHMHGCLCNTMNESTAPQDDFMHAKNPVFPYSSSNPLDSFRTASAVSGVQCPTIQPGIVSKFPGSVPLPVQSINYKGKDKETTIISKSYPVSSNLEMGRESFGKEEENKKLLQLGLEIGRKPFGKEEAALWAK